MVSCDDEIEGKKAAYFTTRYERGRDNRNKAILLNGGCVYSCCGFDFESVYGDIDKGFIEAHHNKPLCSLNEPIQINPETDLDYVCSNCHKMLHRSKENILTVDELRLLLLILPQNPIQS